MSLATAMADFPPAPPRPPHPVGVRLPVPDDWATAIDTFLADLEGMGRPRTSLRSYRSALEHLARRSELGPYQQTRTSLRAYFTSQREWAVETRRARKSTLVAFYDWAVQDERMEHNPARQLPKIGAAKPHPRPVPEDAYQRALAAAAPRERLMLRLSHDMGLRRDEVARIHTDDLWPDFNGEGTVLNVHGKGSKVREMPVPDSLALELSRMPAGYIFPGKREGHLSAEYVGRKLAELLPGAHRMHGLRHSYATRLYKDSGDLLTVQEALGHTSPKTTELYIASDNRSKLRALQEGMARPRIV